ncbi:MAG TPA: class I SAM-dependent methyltransferase [Phycisphaerae bacterium]|nr:class I SAM-dependent methyltransferase [Phycisphaerae bacterium]
MAETGQTSMNACGELDVKESVSEGAAIGRSDARPATKAGLFARLRMQWETALEGSELYWYASSAYYPSATQIIPLLKKSARGKLLDVGCGKMPFRKYIEGQVESYDGLDIERRSPKTRFIADAHDMGVIPTGSYDTVISISALEHMARPWVAVREMRRVCRPGGLVVVCVPHMSRLHEEPHDYFRFSPYGLASLGQWAGLCVQKTQPAGGLFCMLGHQISTIVLTLGWVIPLVRWFFFGLNYLLIVWPCVMLDRLLRSHLKFPMNVVAVYRVPDQDPLEGSMRDSPRGSDAETR